MNKIIVTEFVSLDGVMEGPGPQDPFELAGWTMPYVNEQFMKFKAEELFSAGALLLGRTTYEGFSDAWPKMANQGDAFADKMNSMPKYVVSSTLNTAPWENSHLIKENVVAELKKLKDSAEGDLLVCGSSVLIQTLMTENLVDEYRLLVYPVVLGKGKKLFKDGDHAKLTLTEARPFDTGVVLLRYVV
jgi:dihydrofolate reductase